MKRFMVKCISKMRKPQEIPVVKNKEEIVLLEQIVELLKEKN